ncbi:hypothetical protein [Pontiella sp.]|uniref:hypothetical protein n=1 Tax=Pontiella sp. TaxID=2837462 RepID=UPI003566C856
MNTKPILIPVMCMLTAGCVSQSKIESLIAENNEEVLFPRLELMEAKLGESTRLNEQQRKVLVRHYELLGELSANALSELEKIQ